MKPHTANKLNKFPHANCPFRTESVFSGKGKYDLLRSRSLAAVTTRTTSYFLLRKLGPHRPASQRTNEGHVQLQHQAFRTIGQPRSKMQSRNSSILPIQYRPVGSSSICRCVFNIGLCSAWQCSPLRLRLDKGVDGTHKHLTTAGFQLFSPKLRSPQPRNTQKRILPAFSATSTPIPAPAISMHVCGSGPGRG